MTTILNGRGFPHGSLRGNFRKNKKKIILRLPFNAPPISLCPALPDECICELYTASVSVHLIRQAKILAGSSPLTAQPSSPLPRPCHPLRCMWKSVASCEGILLVSSISPSSLHSARPSSPYFPIAASVHTRASMSSRNPCVWRITSRPGRTPHRHARARASSFGNHGRSSGV